MTWSAGTSRGTRHNRRVRGVGTWGSEGRRLNQHEERRFRREMGHGSWGGQARHLDRNRRRRERNSERGAKIRKFFLTVVTATFILGALLLFSSTARATGMLILFVGAVLCVIFRRKRA